MARWMDELTAEQQDAMKALFRGLKQRKPSGWSVTWGKNEVVVRPAHRSLGKFSLTPSVSQKAQVSFFPQSANCWTVSEHFSLADETAAKLVVDWMVAQVNTACGSIQ